MPCARWLCPAELRRRHPATREGLAVAEATRAAAAAVRGAVAAAGAAGEVVASSTLVAAAAAVDVVVVVAVCVARLLSAPSRAGDDAGEAEGRG